MFSEKMQKSLRNGGIFLTRNQYKILAIFECHLIHYNNKLLKDLDEIILNQSIIYSPVTLALFMR